MYTVYVLYSKGHDKIYVGCINYEKGVAGFISASWRTGACLPKAGSTLPRATRGSFAALFLCIPFLLYAAKTTIKCFSASSPINLTDWLAQVHGDELASRCGAQLSSLINNLSLGIKFMALFLLEIDGVTH